MVSGIKQVYCIYAVLTKNRKIVCAVKKKYLTVITRYAIMPEVKEKTLTQGGLPWTHWKWRCCLITTVAC